MTANGLRIGCGAGFSSDRLEPACDLARGGALDYLVFECVGERTLAFGHRDRMRDPALGYDRHLPARLGAILPLTRAAGTTVISNMGAANPAAAGERALQIARELGLEGLRIAVVTGDEVTDRFGPDTPLSDHDGCVADVGLPLVGANAYLGIDALLPALADGADLVIGGRIADPSLFLAPMVHRFGWAGDDWRRLGAGTLVGHLLECGMQVTGGYFADPGVKDVRDLAYAGYPFAEVGADGAAVIGKLDGTGGCVTPRTVREQLLYEVHDPAAYLTPDVTASFAQVQIAEAGSDRVRVAGADGAPRPQRLKVTVGFDGGLLAEAGVSYAGPGAQGRARLAAAIVEERMRAVHGYQGRLRLDLVGVNALHASAVERETETEDVRLRAALRSAKREDAERLLWEVEALLCCGPAGGGGYRGNVVPSVVTHSAFIDRTAVRPAVRMLVA